MTKTDKLIIWSIRLTLLALIAVILLVVFG